MPVLYRKPLQVPRAWQAHTDPSARKDEVRPQRPGATVVQTQCRAAELAARPGPALGRVRHSELASGSSRFRPRYQGILVSPHNLRDAPSCVYAPSSAMLMISVWHVSGNGSVCNSRPGSRSDNGPSVWLRAATGTFRAMTRCRSRLVCTPRFPVAMPARGPDAAVCLPDAWHGCQLHRLAATGSLPPPAYPPSSNIRRPRGKRT